MRLFTASALIVLALIALTNFCNSDTITDAPEPSTPHSDLVDNDPWSTAEHQHELTVEAWTDGNMAAAVIHANNATIAAFASVPDEATVWRRERAFSPNPDEVDIWERGRDLSATAQASTSWAGTRYGMRPKNYAENYDNASVARADSRDAAQYVNQVWEMTRIHWEEHEGMPTEEEWGHSTLAWAHAASAWSYARDLVDDFFTEVFDAWFQNL